MYLPSGLVGPPEGLVGPPDVKVQVKGSAEPVDDHAAGPPPCRRRTPRPVADRVARRIVHDVGHVLEEELLAPRGGGVVDEGERREASLLRSGVVGARGVPRDTTAR